MLVVLVLSLAMSACTSTSSAALSKSTVTIPTNVHLRDLAQAHSLFLGAAVNMSALQSDRTYATLLGQQFDMVTPENAMKFGATEPQQGVFDFTQGDALVAFARAHGMQVRGHNFVWHQALPSWLTAGHFSKAQLMTILQNHITTVLQHYQGEVNIWDVVNEAINDQGNLRRNIWLDTIGPDYIAQAFRWAHEADPQAHLFYNDYSADGLGTKSDAVYQMVKGLVQSDVPIYGVGLQMHVSISHSPSEQDVLANMRRLAALGLKVHITEMDVSLTNNYEPFVSPVTIHATPDQLARQAQIYHAILNACLVTKACEAFVMWGFVDRYSWLNGNSLVPNHTNAPLIYDENYHPKPAFAALVEALNGK
jgi:endo-1,4-beta-xylanase